LVYTGKKRAFAMTKFSILLLLPLFLLSGCTGREDISNRSVYTAETEFDPAKKIVHCTVSINWENNTGSKVLDIPLQFRFQNRVHNIHNVLINGKCAEYSIIYPDKADPKYITAAAASTNNRVSATSAAATAASNDNSAPKASEASGTTEKTDSFSGVIVHRGKRIRAGSSVSVSLTYSMEMAESFRDQIFVFSELFPVIPPVKEGEFMYNYQVHSDYQVSVSIPDGDMVASTGLSMEERVINGIKTIDTYAEAVPSYGIVVMDSDVQISETEQEGCLIRSFYFEDDAKWGEKLTTLASDIIGFYIDTLGFYPQPLLNIIPGYESPQGGWPVSPNIVGVHRGIDMKRDPASHASWIMAHEIAHQYWGFNYILEPLDYPQWYGISMGIFTDHLYTSARGVNKDYNRFFFGPYTDGVEKGYNTVIMQHTDSLDMQGFDWNNVILHGKSWAALRMLEQEIGEEKMLKLFYYSLNNYKGVNVTLQMFMDDCEMIAGRDMDQFFNTWYLQNRHLEYFVGEIIVPQGDPGGFSQITVIRVGDTSAEKVDLAFVLEDNDTLITVIEGRKDTVKLSARFSSPLREVIPDPYFKLPLVNRKSRRVTDIF
jgi:hypothetical protein